MKEVRNITCRQAHRLLHERLDGALPPAAEERLRGHWAHCAACAEHARRVQTAVEALRSAPVPQPDAALVGRIRATVGTALRPAPAPAPAPRLRLAPVWAAAGAAAVLALALIFAYRLPPLAPTTPSPAPPVIATLPPASEPTPEAEPAPAGLPSPQVVPAAPTMAAAGTAAPSPALRTSRAPRTAARAPALGAPAPPAGPAPRLAHVPARAVMADMTAASVRAPLANTVEETPRVSPVNLASVSPHSAHVSGDFACEMMSGLVADAVLSNYLEGAPPGLRVTPAVLSTGGSG